MDTGYGLNESARVVPAEERLRSSRIHAHRSRQCFQHLPHDLRLQLRRLCLKSLRYGMLDKLPHLVLFVALFRHTDRTVYLLETCSSGDIRTKLNPNC